MWLRLFPCPAFRSGHAAAGSMGGGGAPVGASISGLGPAFHRGDRPVARLRCRCAVTQARAAGEVVARDREPGAGCGRQVVLTQPTGCPAAGAAPVPDICVARTRLLYFGT
jgi:hypothetical protein